jgi:hypothetical protein
MSNQPNYNGKIGIVTNVDSKGYLYGTWGPPPIIPNIDIYTVIE